MRFVDWISLIVDNLKRRTGRVILTAIGVIIGTAAVVTLISLGRGLQESATSQLYGINDLSSVQVYPGYPDMSINSGMTMYSEDDIKKLTPDVVEQFEAMPEVERVIIKSDLQAGTNVKLDKLEGYASIQALNIDDLSQMGLTAQTGVTDLTQKESCGWLVD